MGSAREQNLKWYKENDHCPEEPHRQNREHNHHQKNTTSSTCTTSTLVPAPPPEAPSAATTRHWLPAYPLKELDIRFVNSCLQLLAFGAHNFRPKALLNGESVMPGLSMGGLCYIVRLAPRSNYRDFQAELCLECAGLKNFNMILISSRGFV